MEVSWVIERIKAESGYPISKLASMINVDKSTLWHYCQGTTVPKKEIQRKIKALARKFDITEFNKKDKTIVSKVIYKEKMNGKMFALTRLSYYSEKFAVGYDVNIIGRKFNPDKGRLIHGFSKAYKFYEKCLSNRVDEDMIKSIEIEEPRRKW
jgi:hypothetical protein